MVRRREYVKPVWRDERSCLCADGRSELRTGPGAGVYRLDQARIANCHVDEATRGIEKGCVGNPGKGPLIAHPSGERIDFYERATIAGDVEEFRPVVDVDPMRAVRGKRPVPYIVELRQPGNQDH